MKFNTEELKEIVKQWLVQNYNVSYDKITNVAYDYNDFHKTFSATAVIITEDAKLGPYRSDESKAKR